MRQRLPPAIIGYIFDLAQFWIETRVQTANPMMINQRDGFAVDNVRSPPVSGYLPSQVAKYFLQPPVSRKLSQKAHTLVTVEAGKVEAHDGDIKKAIPPVQTGPVCFLNRHRGPLVPGRKTCEWPRSQPSLILSTENRSGFIVFFWAKESTNTACAKWVRELRPGQRVILTLIK